MRPARVAAGLALVAATWCALAAVRSLVAPHCAGAFPCMDVRFVSGASGAFAALLAAAALWPADAMRRDAWVLAPLPLVGLLPVGNHLLLFQPVNVRCGIVEDLASGTPCAHPNWWLVPGLFAVLLATLVLVRASAAGHRASRGASAVPLSPVAPVAPLASAPEPVAMLARVTLVAAGVTMLVLAAALAAVAQALGETLADARALAGMGALAIVGAAAWAAFSRRAG